MSQKRVGFKSGFGFKPGGFGFGFGFKKKGGGFGFGFGLGFKTKGWIWIWIGIRGARICTSLIQIALSIEKGRIWIRILNRKAMAIEVGDKNYI